MAHKVHYHFLIDFSQILFKIRNPSNLPKISPYIREIFKNLSLKTENYLKIP